MDVEAVLIGLEEIRLLMKERQVVALIQSHSSCLETSFHTWHIFQPAEVQDGLSQKFGMIWREMVEMEVGIWLFC